MGGGFKHIAAVILQKGGGFKHIAAVIVGFVAVSIVGFGRGRVYWTLSWVVKKP